MSNNHYQMSERATAQIEIDYLRDEVSRLKKLLKDEKVAKELLTSKGYFVDNLWSIEDVKMNYDCDKDTAYEILGEALTSDYIIEKVFNQISDIAYERTIRLLDQTF